ncbi:hypothetical protein [Aestuariibacter salexigens]|nr:hypothetical protein [Aestuariibacter salexigens]
MKNKFISIVVFINFLTQVLAAENMDYQMLLNEINEGVIKEVTINGNAR